MKRIKKKQPTIQPPKSEHWNTPPLIIEKIREFAGGQIGLDPCGNEFSQVSARVNLTKEQDGLGADWVSPTEPEELIFINPPYDMKTLDFVASKGLDTSRLFGRDVLLLVPVKSDQTWFQNATLVRARAICFIKGRVKFHEDGKPRKGGAPMACCLLWFKGSYRTYERFSEAFSSLGRCIKLG